MAERMTGDELVAMVQRVFQPRPGEERLAILVDLPDSKVGDDAPWKARRDIALDWCRELGARAEDLGLETDLVLYRNTHTNNGDLPDRAWIHAGGPLPSAVEELDPTASTLLSEIYAEHPILLAPTKFSATAPLKMAAKRFPIRAATMPGFGAEMIPSLRLDYREINRRVHLLKDLLDRAEEAEFRFRHPSGESALRLDLRHRSAHASGGLLPEPGVAGNLPSGEAYIVPYEGEVAGDPSRSSGELPVQFGFEVVRYRIEANKAVAVLSRGPESDREAALLEGEPAYGNIAELGLGVLAHFGVKPIGEVLLDEKLGLHIAFGRSEHFGGQVGPSAFSSPEAVVHIDRVYVPEVMPEVQVLVMDLLLEDGGRVAILQDSAYVLDFGI
jgi:hypothetical protein